MAASAAMRHADAYAHGYSYGHAHTNSHRYGYGDGDCDLDAYTYQHAQTYADGQAAADGSPAADSIALAKALSAGTREKRLASSPPEMEGSACVSLAPRQTQKLVTGRVRRRSFELVLRCIKPT